MKKTLIFLSFLSMSACYHQPINYVMPDGVQKKVIKTVGYGAITSYKNYPLAQRKLLAIRGARLDAYRNLAEEIHGIKISGETTVKDMVVQSDSYRVSLNAMLRGANVHSINELKNGIFEAHATIELSPRYTACLYNPSQMCLNIANQYQPGVVVIQDNNSRVNFQSGLGIFPAQPHRD